MDELMFVKGQHVAGTQGLCSFSVSGRGKNLKYIPMYYKPTEQVSRGKRVDATNHVIHLGTRPNLHDDTVRKRALGLCGFYSLLPQQSLGPEARGFVKGPAAPLPQVNSENIYYQMASHGSRHHWKD